MPGPYTLLLNSSFLNLTSNGMTTVTPATTVQEAYDLQQGSWRAASETVNVALILPRANDPTALLDSNWATRQRTLAELKANGTLWSTYGASSSDYTALTDYLTGHGFTVLGTAGNDGYISSAASRTVWVRLDGKQFHDLFNTDAFQTSTLAGNGLYFWNGNLSLPTGLNVAGLWFDFLIYGPHPAFSDLSGGASAPIVDGPQSIGNAGTNHASLFSGEIARSLYHYPLGSDVPTETVGMIEPGSADILPTGAPYTFQQALDRFRSAAGLSTPGHYYSVASGGTNYDMSNPGERSLDVGVVASAVPGSTIGLYAGSGFDS